MGVEPRSGQLPEPLDCRGFWKSDEVSPSSDDRLVIPNFKKNFSEQSAWHQEVVKINKERGLGLTRGELTESDIKALSTETILDRLQNAFKNAKAKYNTQHKALTEQEVKQQRKRKLGRKSRVSNLIYCINKLFTHILTSVEGRGTISDSEQDPSPQRERVRLAL